MDFLCVTSRMLLYRDEKSWDVYLSNWNCGCLRGGRMLQLVTCCGVIVQGSRKGCLGFTASSTSLAIYRLPDA
jgi:hypothetical protein